MATIKKRERKDGTPTYMVMIRLAGYSPVTKTFDRKADAVAWATETESAMRGRRYTDPAQADKITLFNALDRYINEVTVKKKPNTQDREKRAAKQVALGIGTETPISMITPSVVARYRDKRGKVVSAYTVRMEMALLSHLYKIMRKEWEIPCANPVSDVDRPAPPKGRTRFLTQKEAQSLLESCGNRRNKMLRSFVLAMLHTGMRPSEAAGVKWRQVDLAKRILLLEDTKTGGNRVVPLTTALIDELVRIKQGRGGDEYVFLTDKQASLHAPRFSQAFRMAFIAARKEAGVPDIRMHDLRHTAASYLLMSGCDLRTLADILGHTTLAMVQRYTHLLDAHKIDAVDKIGGLGFGG